MLTTRSNQDRSQLHQLLFLRFFESPLHQHLFLCLNPVSLSPKLVPKTYIYVDDIRIGGEIVDHLTSILHARNSNLATKGLIRPFNATLSHEYRDAAMQAFRDNQDSTNSGGNIRILVCTDAAGMVCHLC